MNADTIIKKLSEKRARLQKHICEGRLKAASLMEVVFVLIIIGILATLAAPKLLGLLSDARSTEAQTHLNFIHTLEKTHFYKKSTYSADINEIKYEQPKLSTEGGNANYKYEVVQAANNTFTARATAVKDFDGDGVFSVWEIDQDQKLTEVTPD